MRHILAIALLAGLSFTPAPANAQSKIVNVPIGPTPACPALPGVTNVIISGVPGPDFWSCTATHVQSGRRLFDIYVGNHPARPGPGYRFAGYTYFGDKSLVWFAQPTGDRSSPVTWQTYLPTGDLRMSVMVVSLERTGFFDLEEITPLIAHLKIGY